MNKTINIRYSDYDNEHNVLSTYIPECKEFDLYIFLHGGGLKNGGPGEIDITAEALCREGIAVISADYRMYPNAKYPNFIEDAADAVKWSLDNISKYGKCNKVFIGGSSAGAYLAMMLCFDSKYLAKHGLKPTDFDGFIFDAGQPTAHFNVLEERGIDPKRVIIDETAPLYHIGTADKYPPMQFIVSDSDIECRYEQIMLTLATLKQLGHKNVYFKLMENSTHCAYLHSEDKNPPYSETVLSFIKNTKKEV